MAGGPDTVSQKGLLFPWPKVQLISFFFCHEPLTVTIESALHTEAKGVDKGAVVSVWMERGLTIRNRPLERMLCSNLKITWAELLNICTCTCSYLYAYSTNYAWSLDRLIMVPVHEQCTCVHGYDVSPHIQCFKAREQIF